MPRSAEARPKRRIRLVIATTISTLLVATVLGVTVNAATTSKPYTATWLQTGSPISNPPNILGISPGSQTLSLQLTNNASPQSLGSANLTVPAGYTLNDGAASQGTATVSGGSLLLRNLNLATGASLVVAIGITTPCLADGTPQTWGLRVKQANDFSGPPGNDFVRASGTAAPATAISGTSLCQLRFANQPNTTQTNATITDGFGSSGNAIRVEIFDPATDLVVNSSADVTLATQFNSSGGTLTGGGPVSAVAGVATFSAMSLNRPGPYTLRASSAAASNTPDTNQFMVSDTLATCSGTGCSFTVNQDANTYTLTPKKGISGATFVRTLNLPGLRISCDFAPYNYPDARQPNAVWYGYSDGSTNSLKTNVISIDKTVVQATPNNGTSFYRVCYSSPVPFTDRNGNPAPQDPWPDGPSVYFGTTWYTGLLPDCAKKNPVAPCVVSWTGDNAGDRIGTFLTPPGDPSYR